MIETIKSTLSAKIAVLLFVALSVMWFYTQLATPENDFSRELFAAIYGIVALWGAICGVLISQKWGGFKSIMGRALLMFSIGLFLQEFGQLAYSFYIYFLHIEVPYPSWGDLGYFGSIPFYIYGIWLLGKAAGIKIGVKSFTNKIWAVIIPVIILSVSYFIFFSHGYDFVGSNPLTIFLDFGYPFGQAIYVSIALVTYFLSRNVLGGIMKNKILFILFALIFQYIADFTFLLQASNGTWVVGGINDYLYLISYFLMTLSLIQFSSVLGKLK